MFLKLKQIKSGHVNLAHVNGMWLVLEITMLHMMIQIFFDEMKYLQHWLHPQCVLLMVGPISLQSLSWSKISHNHVNLCCQLTQNYGNICLNIFWSVSTFCVWFRSRLISSCCWRINCLSLDAASFCSWRRLISAWRGKPFLWCISATLPHCMNSIYMYINVYLELIWPILVQVLWPVVPGASFWVPVVVWLFVDRCHLLLCYGFVVFVVPAKITLLSFFPLMLSLEVSVKMTRIKD